MTKLIAFAGQARSGKDLSANFLAELLRWQTGDTWKRRAFATPVKDIYCRAFGVTSEFIEEWKCKNEIPPGFLKPVRPSLQFIGDGFRAIKDTCWIDMATDDEHPDNAILSDSRYINEGKAVAERGGYNVVMWRPGFENDDPNQSEAQIRKIVEFCLATDQDGPIDLSGIPQERWVAGIEHYHYFLRNDGDIDKLQYRVQHELLPAVTATFVLSAAA